MTSKVTSEIVTNDDGSVVITNQSGKVKKRKGQLEEKYQEQLLEFLSKGPEINEQGHLLRAYEKQLLLFNQLKSQPAFETLDLSQSLTTFNIDSSVQRRELIQTAENQYYRRNYDKSIEICDQILELFAAFNPSQKHRLQIEEVNKIKHYSLLKKSSIIERA